MPGAKVVDCEYFAFNVLLRRSTDAGTRIDPSDTERWGAYIRAHGINEVGAAAIARARYADAIAVIIADGSEADGLYFYSSTGEGAMRLVPYRPRAAGPAATPGNG